MSIFAKIKTFLRPGPLSCQQVNRFILDYVEGTIDEPTRVAFEAHLRHCPNCASFLDQYCATARLVQEADDIEVPPAVIERTIEFLRSRNEAATDHAMAPTDSARGAPNGRQEVDYAAKSSNVPRENVVAATRCETPDGGTLT